MNKKIKKIITASIVSVASVSAIGCSTTNNKLAKNIDKSMAEFVSSINKLDYVDTNTSTEKIGKIMETSANSSAYLNEKATTLDIENTITRPTERTDNFSLFVLSSKPFVSLTSDDNSAIVDFSLKFSTNKIEETSDVINEKINKLILKRSILMIYVNEIYSRNVNLTEENKVAINAYVNVIKENASFLNGNRGMVRNQLGLASNLVENEKNDNLVNYYIIKSGEALETRSNKIESTISAIDSIIDILEINLTPNSPYYNSKLSTAYNNLISNLQNTNTQNNQTNSNTEIADKISESLHFKSNITTNSSTSSEQYQTINNSNSEYKNTNPLTKDIKDPVQYRNNLNSTQNITNSQPIQNNQSPYTNSKVQTLQNNTNNKISIEENQENSSNMQSGVINQNKIIRDTSSRKNATRRNRRRNNLNSQNNTNQNNKKRPIISTGTNESEGVKTLEETEESSINHNRQITNEEYTSTWQNNQTNSHRSNATRVPYQSINSNFNK